MIYGIWSKIWWKVVYHMCRYVYIYTFTYIMYDLGRTYQESVHVFVWWSHKKSQWSIHLLKKTNWYHWWSSILAGFSMDFPIFHEFSMDFPCFPWVFHRKQPSIGGYPMQDPQRRSAVRPGLKGPWPRPPRRVSLPLLASMPRNLT